MSVTILCQTDASEGAFEAEISIMAGSYSQVIESVLYEDSVLQKDCVPHAVLEKY